MTAATHTAALVLELYAVDDEHAREIVSLAAASVAPLGGVLALEASPPTQAPARARQPRHEQRAAGRMALTHRPRADRHARARLPRIQDKLERARPGLSRTATASRSSLDRLGVDELAPCPPSARCTRCTAGAGHDAAPRGRRRPRSRRGTGSASRTMVRAVGPRRRGARRGVRAAHRPAPAS
jgi:hypothetical protein